MSQLFIDPGQPCKGRKIALCTVAYDQPSPGYAYAIAQSREALSKAGYGSAYFLLSGNCHVDDARNTVVQEFLLSDCADLVFLDADVIWEPEQLVKLCGFDVDIVGGVYPFRRDDEKSKQNMPVVMLPGVVEPDDKGLTEVAGLPAGFMKIRRHVLEKLTQTAQKYWNRNDRRSQIGILFERTFFDGIRLGGDLSFCKKWIEAGGSVYAAGDIYLGHTVKSIVYDSLNAALRRQAGETIRYVADQVKRGCSDPQLFQEARRFLGNPWGALEDVLTMCAILGHQSQGPIIEAGSGLTSVILGAASREPVFCLEHDPKWSAETERLADQADVKIHVVRCDIRDGWYQVPEGLPSEFALGLNDGPPRTIGSRMGFFDHFDADAIICDDADDFGYGDQLKSWAAERNRRIDFVERSALIRK